ncbi:hypothetical protein IWX90DRAFT_185402 [Phyllosticta citrichinensis]|uniref:Zn(2)-C6 fungal-type domain-containing protein n=1 Tax=Phyllosticta citrichinensis TaxID=1130410 RepID=A0ABR1XWF1_9PEZI
MSPTETDMLPSASRKPHRKSRNGCGHCKRRKIKCDETKPVCRNCVKHAIQCDYPDIMARKAASSLRSPQTLPSLPPSSAHLHFPATRPETSATSSPLVNGEVALLEDEEHMRLNMVDLELLHNFSTSTSHTITANPELRTLWRMEVPCLAFKYDFVMRAILAVSALHMGYWKPESADFYVQRAIAHHKIGLRGPTAILPHVTRDNCSPLYVFSALTAMLSLAMPRKSDDFLFVGTEGVADWLFLMRGITSVIESSRDWILSGSIGAMLHRVNRDGFDPHTSNTEPRPPEEDHLADLRRFVEREMAEKPEDREIYVGALDELSKSYHIVHRLGPTDCRMRPIFSWSCQVSNEYLTRLTNHESMSLVIFAHYAVLLHRLDHLWWVKGWGTHLITKIYALVESVYRQWLRWPVEEIGWVPSHGGLAAPGTSSPWS